MNLILYKLKQETGEKLDTLPSCGRYTNKLEEEKVVQTRVQTSDSVQLIDP